MNFQNHLPITGRPHQITSSLRLSPCPSVRSLWHNFWFYLYAFDFDLFTLPTVHAHLHSQFAKCGTCDRINRNMLSIFIFDIGFSLTLSLSFAVHVYIFKFISSVWNQMMFTLWARQGDGEEKTKEKKKRPGLPPSFLYRPLFSLRFVTGCQPRENYVCCW